eukprot:scaffold2312_cov165-Ochromonas_danica.AAC.76
MTIVLCLSLLLCSPSTTNRSAHKRQHEAAAIVMIALRGVSVPLPFLNVALPHAINTIYQHAKPPNPKETFEE